MRRFSPEQLKWLWSGLIIAIIVTGIYLVLSFPRFGFVRPGMISQVTSRSSQGVTNPPPEPDKSSITTEAMEAFILSLKTSTPGHDPFLSHGEQGWKDFLGGLKDLPPKLEGIIQVEDKRVALIQSARFREGDEVKGFQIVKIGDKNVLLTKAGKIYTMNLND